MTRPQRRSRLSALAAAVAIFAPAAVAQAVPVMTTSSDGTTFRIDVTGGGPNKSIYFLRLPSGIDHAILPDVYAAVTAGATLVYSTSTSTAGEFHASFPVSIFPEDVEFAAYGARALRFLGTMLPNPSQSAVLVPGVGFTGPTPEPGQIGAGTAKAIARWDVVPYQTITEATGPTLNVGVVAFHIAGIDRVEMSVEGGPWAAVRQMTLNPQTGVVEYWATIDARDFASDRPIEVRAIAYPGAAAPPAQGTGGYSGGGYPRLLDSVRLYVDAGAPQAPNVAYCSPLGSDGNPGTAAAPVRTPWRAAQIVHNAGGGSADGGIVYMDAGDYDWSATHPNGCVYGTWGWLIPETSDRWLTFQPRPGVTRDQVRIVASTCPGLAIDQVRLHEITLASFVHGDDGGNGGDDKIWLDHVRCVGAGIGTSTHLFGGWTPGFEAMYWTDVESTDNSSSVPGGATLLRNVHCARNQYGPIAPKLVVNCTWDTMNNGGTINHPDFIAWNHLGQQTTVDNGIVYGLTATNIDAQGLFFKNTGHLTNTALVNVAIGLLGVGGSPMGENCQTIDHFLMLNCTLRGPSLRWEMLQSAITNLSIRGSCFDGMAVYGAAAGDTVSNERLDQMHYGPFSPITPGTNVTTGDPQLEDVFTPGPASPLRGRLTTLLVPIDKDGASRTVPATVGAVE